MSFVWMVGSIFLFALAFAALDELTGNADRYRERVKREGYPPHYNGPRP